MERKSFYKKQTHQRLAAAILLWLGCCMLALPQNTVTLTGGEGKPGDQITVSFGLKNADALSAMQVDIPLDESLTFVEGSERIDTERLGGHEIKVSRTEAGVRVLLYSLTLQTMQAGESRLLTFDLRLKRAPGTYTLRPQVKLTGSDGKTLPCESIAADVVIRAARLNLLTPTIDFGKVPAEMTHTAAIRVENTGNEAMQIKDLTTSDDWMVCAKQPQSIDGGESASFTLQLNPKNKGIYNGSITLEANALDGLQTISVLADVYTINELHLQSVAGICDETVRVPVRLKNTEKISAIQFDIELPHTLEFMPESVESAVPSHKASATFKDGKLTMMMYSLSDASIGKGDQVVMYFAVKLNGKSGIYNLVPQNVKLGNMMLENVCSVSRGAQITISSPRIQCASVLDMENIDIETGSSCTFAVKNAGSSTLVIDKVTFTEERLSLDTPLPIVVEPDGEKELRIQSNSFDAEGELHAVMNIYCNDPEERMKPVDVNGFLYASNTLNLQKLEQTSELGVAMRNRSEITAFQMDVHCAKGVVLAKENITASGRMKNHEIHCAGMGNGIYRISSYSLTNERIAGNSGLLFTMGSTQSITSDKILYIDNVKLSDAQGKNKYTGKEVKFETVTNSSGLQLELSKGWNWISSNLSDADLQQASRFISPIQKDVIRFVGFESELLNDGQLGLVGQLETLSPVSSYRIQMNADVTYTWNGSVCNAEDTPVTLNEGWNWMGYIPDKELPLENALSNHIPEEGDVIKSYEDFSTYEDGRWEGTLATLKPGEGYMYYSGKETTFRYNTATPANLAVKVPAKSNSISRELPWEVVKHKYADNMALIAQLYDSSGGEIQKEEYIVGAFVGDECRGVGQTVNGKSFMIIYGELNESETIVFKAFDRQTREEWGITEICTFDLSLTGTCANPFRLTLNNATGLPIEREQMSNLKLFMDSDQKKLYVNGVDQIRNISILHPNGQLLMSTSLSPTNGIDIAQLPGGIFLVVIRTDVGSIRKKIIKD